MSFRQHNTWSHEECCTAVKKIGLHPLLNPDPKYIYKALQVIKRCFEIYIPSSEELELVGFFLYDDRLQDNPEFQNSLGYTCEIQPGEALIGLSTSLFDVSNSEAFYDTVFLHELAHLAVMNHGDDFEIRLHSILYDYYTDHNVRIDGKEVILQRNTIFY